MNQINMNIVVRNIAIALCIMVNTLSLQAQTQTIIEGKVYDAGLKLTDVNNVLIKNCRFSNREGMYGLFLERCSNVRIENCTIESVGNESFYENNTYKGQPSEYMTREVSGLELLDCNKVVFFKNTVMDIFGRGILVKATSVETAGEFTIDSCRIVYTYDDAILVSTAKAQGSPETDLPYKGGKILNNTIHDIGLAITKNGYHRHGMYLKSSDILVEGNNIYNCFYGQGISLRNAGTIRNNRVRNCVFGGIAFWAQTNTTKSTKKVLIENNEIRQDYYYTVPLRHIFTPEKLEKGGAGAGSIIFQYTDKPYLQVDSIIVRNNKILWKKDVLSENPMITGNGNIAFSNAVIQIYGNVLTDEREKHVPFFNIPEKVDLTRNNLKGTK